MMEVIKRYEWEDSLIEAHRVGLIENGALLVALKLAKAIHWAPVGKPSGLYWANTQALEAVGAGRSTFYRHRSDLFKAGFFKEEKGNLIPLIPDLSSIETATSQAETDESPVETAESPGGKTYSEDTYTDKEYSEDYSLQVTTAAKAPAVTLIPLEEDASFAGSLNSRRLRPLTTLLLSKVKVPAVSSRDSEAVVS
jgi:hypothetical protein